MARQYCIPATYDVSYYHVSIILTAWPPNTSTAEPWWVEALVRNPTVLHYAHGVRRLDTIYLDTTFAAERHNNPAFPTKAEGLAELLSTVARYPQNTIFHFHAWTFGYEEVWIALANALDSRVSHIRRSSHCRLTQFKIHVDDYKSRIYQSLRLRVDDRATSSKEGNLDNSTKRAYDTYLAPEAPSLCGHWCGNNDQPGYLTNDQNVRLHSCEAGTGCKALNSPEVVWITPILTRSVDGDVLEIGAGGGGGDLTQHELEVDDQNTTEELLQLCFRALEDTSTKVEIERMISEAFHSPAQRISLDSISSAFSGRELPLEHFARSLADVVRIVTRKRENKGDAKAESRKTLPRQIVRGYQVPLRLDMADFEGSVFPTLDIPRTMSFATLLVHSSRRISIHAPLTSRIGLEV